MKYALTVVAIILSACVFFIFLSKPMVDANASEKKAQFKIEQKASVNAVMCKNFPELSVCSK